MVVDEHNPQPGMTSGEGGKRSGERCLGTVFGPLEWWLQLHGPGNRDPGKDRKRNAWSQERVIKVEETGVRRPSGLLGRE